MKRIHLVLFCQLLFAPVAMAGLPPLHGTLQWHALSVDESFQNAKVFGTAFLFSIPDLKVTESITLEAEAGVNLEIGSNNSTYIKEFAPQREVVLRKAYLEFLPVSFIQMKAGAINQQDYQSPLLLGGRAFVAAQEQLTIPIGELKNITLRSQQAIPSNDTLTNRIGAVEGKPPQFMIHSLGADFDGDVISIQLEASLWRFQTLPNSVAYYSRFMGNTVVGIGTDASRFYYNYYGKNASFKIGLFESSPINFIFSGQWVRNDEAATGHDTGLMASGGLGLYGHRFSLHWLKNESDSSVAFYNASSLGHNNRKGYGVSLEGAVNPVWNYSLKYWNLDLIESNLYQSAGTRFQFGLERSF
ncbi:MAG: hypothetical protein COW00_07245 [Bdellovibrio sp. CG12_big_fil_rev_8_21_14_0_65_39_13]|nr:MAG: hypothetical protein COW78_16975 [Bdellovibrio sp. CG22_combo_CG10-13_8_21_14_all_39_27]PIQ60282.1 MAG: hypothetical protein COW00_07245 [Bdellovibrio sp. CG12_big_fil_rev_8_21_14_0_65_39_13]PIR34718.1 MAG: hypothetical protein COV37_12350 [Bdellovibrio sp. CG11_big_fil_rev_8_21_14_0_20_39_38]